MNFWQVDNSNYHVQWGPHYPEGELWGPEILGSMGRCRPCLSNRDEIWHAQAYHLTKETCLPNLGLIAIRVGETCGPILAKCFDCGRTVWRISFILAGTYPWRTAIPTPNGDPILPEGELWAPKCWVPWGRIGQL